MIVPPYRRDGKMFRVRKCDAAVCTGSRSDCAAAALAAHDVKMTKALRRHRVTARRRGLIEPEGVARKIVVEDVLPFGPLGGRGYRPGFEIGRGGVAGDPEHEIERSRLEERISQIDALQGAPQRCALPSARGGVQI